MELPVVCASVCIPRSIILFLHAQNISPIEIHHQLTFVFGNIMMIQHVREWCHEFSEGWRDNARPHSARITQELLKIFNWAIFEYPPYSPDLASSDFALFPALQQILGGQHFQNDEEVKNFTKKFYYAIFFKFGCHILPHIDAKPRPALR